MVAEAGVVERDVDEDGLVVAAVVGWYGVGEAELGGYSGAGVGEQREGEGVLLEGEVVLARGLGGDGYEEGSTAADLGLEFAPGFELGDAVGTPAASEEVDDEGAEGQEVFGADWLAGDGVLEGEGRGLCAGFEDAVFDAGGQEFGGGLLGDGEALGLDQLTGVGGDGVELVL